jgi:hypothetical protein
MMTTVTTILTVWTMTKNEKNAVGKDDFKSLMSIAYTYYCDLSVNNCFCFCCHHRYFRICLILVGSFKLFQRLCKGRIYYRRHQKSKRSYCYIDQCLKISHDINQYKWRSNAIMHWMIRLMYLQWLYHLSFPVLFFLMQWR